MARKHKLAAAVFSLGCLHASSLMALGLGELELESFLNQPLKARVDLLNLDGLDEDQIRIRLATSEDFDKLGVERAYFLTNISFDVVAGGTGGARILIRSEKPVLEPYLDFIVEARWPSGRLLREYTVLLDPPVFADAPAAVSANQRVLEVDSTASALKKSTARPTGLFNQVDNAAIVGTQVELRSSNLAPTSMPQRNYNANTAATPTAGSRYMVGRDETLWHIANQAKPVGTSVHQEMLEIQRLNPDAFVNGNINRLKAGYIVYLPKAEDISSTDRPTALAAVREQNAAWREGRDVQAIGGGPSLRISAGQDEQPATVAAAETTADPQSPQVSSSATAQDRTTPATEQMNAAAETTGQSLETTQEQVATLRRIVTLKDEQIAALQNALAEAGVATETLDVGAVDPDTVPEVDAAGEPATNAVSATAGSDTLPATGPSAGDAPEGLDDALTASAPVDDLMAEQERPSAVIVDTEVELASEDLTPLEPVSEVVPEAVPEVVPEAVPEAVAEIAPNVPPAKESAPATAPGSKESTGWARYAVYIAGAALIGLVGFLLLRRRGGDPDIASSDVAAAEVNSAHDDVFSDVQLKQQPINAEPIKEQQTADVQTDIEDAAESPVERRADPTRTNRGYGEHKHDEYASATDASDALAEADIYIAYGRHPQAIELLQNALDADPANPVFRLKLLEIYNELNDTASAGEQLDKLRANADAESIAKAEALMAAVAVDTSEEQPPLDFAPALDEEESPGLSPNPLEMMNDTDEELVSEFSGLEIEELGTVDADELDLSSDFTPEQAEGSDHDELVIADDGSGLATKLDLARAYLDMGDDEGARQILEEVVAEGTDAIQSEAQVLLDRIG